MKVIPIAGKLELEHFDGKGNSTGKAWKFPAHTKTPEDFRDFRDYMSHILYSIVVVIVNFCVDKEHPDDIAVAEALYSVGKSLDTLANKYETKWRKATHG
jgi:hypothetical protein